MTPQPSPVRRPKPRWAVAIKARREAIGISQEELAIRADISQSLVSQLERGVQHPTGVSVERFARIIKALEWTTIEFLSATGLEIDHIVPLSAGGTASTENRQYITAEENALKGTKSLNPLPEGLKEAVELYGKRFPDLAHSTWQQYLARFRWRDGQPDDPEAWLDLYRDLTRAGIEPGDP